MLSDIIYVDLTLMNVLFNTFGISQHHTNIFFFSIAAYLEVFYSIHKLDYLFIQLM